jgi:hypothetical protein
MGFKVIKQDNSIIKFTLDSGFNKEDFKKLLGVLSKLLDIGKPFGFYVDSTEAYIAPVNSTINLILWMRKHKSKIPGNLLASAVIIKSNGIANILTAAFRIQPTVSPNKITTDPLVAEEFVKNIMETNLRERLIK